MSDSQPVGLLNTVDSFVPSVSTSTPDKNLETTLGRMGGSGECFY